VKKLLLVGGGHAHLYVVKQGPILFKNIKGLFETGKGERYIPQKSHLSILSTGNKKGFFLYRGHALSGEWAWYIKHWIDKRFVKKISKLDYKAPTVSIVTG
jgi:NADH dehydrogenase FAD-containing subunit